MSVLYLNHWNLAHQIMLNVVIIKQMIIVMLVKVQVINNVIGMNKHYLVKIGQNVVNKGRPLIANIAVPVFGIKDNVNN